MTSDEPAGSRIQLLSRLQQFMDQTLKDLAKASESKDADEREVQAIRNVLLKIVNAWKQATASTQNNSPGIGAEVSETKNVLAEIRKG